ncbi:MAG: hypothetical protein PHI27_06795 [Eubacteriales bacterium]|nr:hypothetical protein [Eubacteriales bacterium]MDD3881942.1 hypothetical protein [Eubacteriales bacterium]MDD4513817.1 hypothetical protein [Eubacteriales bacterium]
MTDKLQRLIGAWKRDYRLSTILSSAVSALVNIAFALFSGALGIMYRSLWHGSICVYYLLLAGVRAILVSEQRKETDSGQKAEKARRTKVYTRTHMLLLLMDISLIAPIAVMVLGERSFAYGLIPAIGMAAYTAYRITMAIIHFRKSSKSGNLFVSELRMINLTDALVALLTLQNTLIIASNGMDGKMQTLSAWTSAGVYAVIIAITIRSFLKAKK